MRLVPTQPKRMGGYEGVLPRRQWEELHDLARPLQGRRVLHVNSTASGGGVAEMLRALVPLSQDLGIDAEWRVFDAPAAFFDVSKRLHNALQGAPTSLSDDDWELYKVVNRAIADSLDPSGYDHILIHDPQPAAAAGFVRDASGPTWAWRCHIDTSRPNPTALRRFLPFLASYGTTIFTLPDYVPPDLSSSSIVIPPGIDPLDAKNQTMSAEEARRRVKGFGVDPDAPLVTQVSRFDPWKDPLGVLDAWKQARREMPDLQLALVGQSADDDPESRDVLRQVLDAAEGQDGVHVVADRADDADVNAFQVASLAIIQKSRREGFGLTVSEALWAGTPVIGGAVGGIPLQIDHGETGFLVDSVEACSAAILELARDPPRARAMGRTGREKVRERFLLPRVLRDEMRLWLRSGAQGRPSATFVRKAF